MKKLLLSLWVLSLTTFVFAAEHTAFSPDKRLHLTVRDDGGQPTYTLNYDGLEVIKPSKLGLKADYGDFTQGMKIVEATEKAVQTVYDMTRTKRAHVDQKATMLTLKLVNDKGYPLQITFYIANNDVAYRYTLLPVKDENPRCAVISQTKRTLL